MLEGGRVLVISLPQPPHILTDAHSSTFFALIRLKNRERQQGGLVTSESKPGRRVGQPAGAAAKARTKGEETHAVLCILTKAKCICSFILHSA